MPSQPEQSLQGNSILKENRSRLIVLCFPARTVRVTVLVKLFCTRVFNHHTGSLILTSGVAHARCVSIADIHGYLSHRYGEHAGKLAEDTVYTAGNIAMTAYQAEGLAVKAVAKRAARDAGSAVIDDIRTAEDDYSDSDAEGANYDSSCAADADAHSTNKHGASASSRCDDVLTCDRKSCDDDDDNGDLKTPGEKSPLSDP